MDFNIRRIKWCETMRKILEEEEDKGMPSLVAPEGLFTQDR